MASDYRQAYLEKRDLQQVGEIRKMDFATLVKEVLNSMTQDKDSESAKLRTSADFLLFSANNATWKGASGSGQIIPRSSWFC